jgi:predicted MFS family arabinose efflux permease
METVSGAGGGWRLHVWLKSVLGHTAMVGLGRTLPALSTTPPISAEERRQTWALICPSRSISSAEVGIERRLHRARPTEVVLAGDG